MLISLIHEGGRVLHPPSKLSMCIVYMRVYKTKTIVNKLEEAPQKQDEYDQSDTSKRPVL